MKNPYCAISCAAEGPFTAEPGYVACERATLAPDLIIGGLAYAADGSLLVYAGADLLRLSADGSRSVLTSFDSPVFGSFVVRAPSERSTYGADPDEQRSSSVYN